MPDTLVKSFYTQTTDAWDAMLSACKKASQTIEMEEYVFQPDQIGNAFMDVFRERAKAGVKVRLLLDWWGCKSITRKDILRSLEDAGVEVRFFRPPSWKWLVKSPRFLPRDHRKIFIIDNKTAYAGGVCINQNYKEWRDTMIEVSGTLVDQLRHVFEQTWLKIEGNEEDIKAHPEYTDSASFSVYANAPESGETRYTDLLMNRLKSAKHSIRLVTPYFTPHSELLDILKERSQKGCLVEIILSNYSKYQPYVVGKKLCGDLIKNGVKIYYFEPHMLHLKMMVIDEHWSAIGSCNLDGLSLHHNQEVMITSTDTGFASELLSHFKKDKTASLFFDNEAWIGRPFSEKCAGVLLSGLRHFL